MSEETRAPDAYACLVCGAVMHERGCRVRCARCGYFEDCANGLTPPPLQRRLCPEPADTAKPRSSPDRK